ncbi:hypothetical protein KO506_06875 [Polaribacter vadi]|uniref:hypothetical protein n=1 Tax=Polaribacter TaxID=52959 RepID=UPI001C09281F|nr:MULTISPECIES: hypothetical protein [Polaribacter]MBU3011119.1 hypothetical protein [Polaribacter vadi]MDO6740933.1 hypothetical protein [Polaribacter sp. 1_MG-2023]
MNEFYLISSNENLSETEFELRNLGNQMIYAIVGNSSRGGWGERTYSNKTIYRETTTKDYDEQFANKLMSFQPVYDLEKILNFHKDYYVGKQNGKEEKYIKHIKYIVYPLIIKKRNSETQQELITDWLDKNMADKKKNNGKLRMDFGDINSPTQFQINSDNSVQTQKIKYSNEDIAKVFELIREDLKEINNSESQELSTEIEKAESKLNNGKDIKNRLLIIGELIKDIGIGTFTSLLSSPIYEMVKPMLGI